jgi:hypothetical protein
MKGNHNLTPTLLLLALSFFPAFLCAQQEEEDLQYLNNQEALSQVQTQVGLSVLIPTEQVPANTGVFITQIGANNQSVIQTASDQSDLNLQQFGNNNSMGLNLRARNIIYSALQQGNGNRLLEFNSDFFGKELIQRDIQQVGNDQNLIIHGSNSLSDRLQVRMSNSGQSLIIRNSN